MGRTEHANGSTTKYGGARIAVTMPRYLFNWVKNAALSSNRSMSAQIVEMLESYVPRKPKSDSPTRGADA
jgi:hypothetical protein